MLSDQLFRQKLQLVGVTAMLLASKYEEIYSPTVKDFIWITGKCLASQTLLILFEAKAYTREEILKMEKMILATLNYNLSTPTPLHFLRRYSKAARSGDPMSTSRLLTL